MNEHTYKEKALATESRKTGGLIIEGKMSSVLISHINAIHQHCVVLDKVKKAIFYNREIKLDGYVSGPSIMLTDREARLLHGAIGALTESEELLESVFGSVVQGKLVDRVNICEELGDWEWYKQIILDATGLSPDEIRDRNIAKLEARYREKKFNADEANNRDLKAEREQLEGSN